MWQPELDFGPSLFGTEEEALQELRADPKAQGWTISFKKSQFYDHIIIIRNAANVLSVGGIVFLLIQ